jgi:ABC-type xylose transport system permease subunit
MTLVLPPFGLFMGKLFALQAVSETMMQSPWQIIVLLGVIIGSVLLALLYFKVVSALLAKESDIKVTERESLPAGFALPLILLSAMIVLASIWLFKTQSGLPLFYLLVPVVLLVLIPWFHRKLEGFDRTSEYHCGEKETFDAALFYFDMTASVKRRVYWFFGLLFVAVALVGVIS